MLQPRRGERCRRGRPSRNLPRVVEIGHSPLVRFFYRLLVSGSVDEVDEVLIAVDPDLLLEMCLERGSLGHDARSARHSGKRARSRAYGGLQLHDLKIRFVSQVVDFGPVDGYASPGLHKAGSDLTILREYEHLGLVEV